MMDKGPLNGAAERAAVVGDSMGSRGVGARRRREKRGSGGDRRGGARQGVKTGPTCGAERGAQEDRRPPGGSLLDAGTEVADTDRFVALGDEPGLGAAVGRGLGDEPRPTAPISDPCQRVCGAHPLSLA